MRAFVRVIGVALLGAWLVGPALAQSQYPDRPIRLVIPQPPGGASDIYVRLIAQRMEAILGQRIVIENRAGASGNLGAEVVAKAPADGYTLLATPSATLTVNPSLYARMPFDWKKDFAPITNLVDLPTLLVVNPALPARSVSELIQLAKKSPGKLNYASAGSGQMIHLAMELFKSSAGVDIVHVPYKGGGQALPDVIAGQVEMMFLSIPATIQHVKAGQLRALGVTSPKRSTALPDVPTIAESGLPGYEVSLWIGLFAPAGTPPQVIRTLNAAARSALTSPEVRERLAADGSDPIGSSPEQVSAQMAAEAVKWAKVLRDVGISPE